MMYQIATLNNGIRIIHKPVDSPVAHCGIVINAGSRDEETEEQGLAHFIEHVIFKGTQKRKAYHILSSMENVGGEINAYTTKEDTCIYASFMYPYYGRWLDLLSDIMFHSVFPQKELDKEKDVIIDEINSYQDQPGEQILDDFDGVIYGDHPLGRNILGKPETLSSLGKEHIARFISRHYATSGMVISSAGRIDLRDLVKLANKYFGDTPQSTRVNGRKAFSAYNPETRIVNRRNHQVHCVLGSIAFAGDHRLKTAMVLLNNILGGPGLNSRLNMAVREKHGCCYHIESHYQPYTDSGVFSIYFGTDPDYTNKTLGLIHKELLSLRTRALGTLQLKRAKEQLKGQAAITFESNLSDMLSMGKSLLVFDRIEDLGEINRKIDLVSTSDLLEAANQVLEPSAISVLTYKP